MLKDVCWVIVLGDFGRSPRMQYHTLSLSQNGYNVQVIAMSGTQPLQSVRDASTVCIHYVPELPAWAARLPTLMALLFKAVFQLMILLWLMMIKLPRPQAILQQDPPAIPAMLVCLLAAKRHGAQWVVDWHNLAYTIMQMSRYSRHRWLISIAKWFERSLGQQAQQHFCVTAAMQQFLQEQFSVKAAVLYDRPPAMFHRCSLQTVHSLMSKLQPQLRQNSIGQCIQQHLAAADSGDNSSNSCTILTSIGADGVPRYRKCRPALVVSSTSWTPDEDFGLLLAAAKQYDAAASQQAAAGSSFPDVLFVITGRGPQREMYLQRIKQLQLQKTAFCSLWLEPEDYPLMLGAADLGVCLHTSSSGLDLPMKVVDMFGAGLPVCAVAYNCIDELVHHGHTGLLFTGAEELAQQLLQLLKGYPDNTNGQLEKLRSAVAKEQSYWRWQDNWDQIALPVFASGQACRTAKAKKTGRGKQL